MRSTLRSIGSVLAGFLAASLVMMVAETINGRFLYPELGRAAAGVTDREVVRAMMAAAPVGALLVVLSGWLLGGLAGGWITARLAARRASGHAHVLGALLTLAGVANNLMVPPPLWFWLAGLAILWPGARVGAYLASRP